MPRMQGRGPGGHRGRNEGPQDEFDQRVLDIARVTRVTKGGKRMRFRATVIVGDKKGRVGLGVEKGADVAAAVNKATRLAKKHCVSAPMAQGTIPHAVQAKYSAAEVLLKPAPQGAGLIVGGPMRIVLELAGIQNVVGKILGSKNKLNNAMATLLALQKLKTKKIIPNEQHTA